MKLDRIAANVLWFFNFAFLTMNASCNVCYSGMFDYDIIVRAVDEEGNPLSGIRLIVEGSDGYQDFYDIHCDCDCYGDGDYCRSTDENGYAVVIAGLGEKWSYCSHDKKPGPPPRPQKLYPWIEYPEDNWTMYEVEITDEMIVKEEPRSLVIDLGTITVNTANDTDDTDDTDDETGDAGADASY